MAGSSGTWTSGTARRSRPARSPGARPGLLDPTIACRPRRGSGQLSQPIQPLDRQIFGETDGKRLLLGPVLSRVLVLVENGLREADAQRRRRDVIGGVEAVRVHQQVIQVRAADLDAERAIHVQGALGPFELHMDPDVGRLLLLDDFDLAVCAIVLAVRALENEATALR